MKTKPLDLTRVDGGDVMAARLPAHDPFRSALLHELVERAIGRWALGNSGETLRDAVIAVVSRQPDGQVVDVRLRRTVGMVTVCAIDETMSADGSVGTLLEDCTEVRS